MRLYNVTLLTRWVSQVVTVHFNETDLYVILHRILRNSYVLFFLEKHF